MRRNTQLERNLLSTGWQANISRVLIFTALCCAFVGGLGWLQPNLAGAETLSAGASTAIAGSARATAAYVVMERIPVTSGGTAVDGKVELNSLTMSNPGTAQVAAGRVYLSTTATTTLPTDAVQIGRTSGVWSANTATTIVLSSGTTTQRTVLTTTPAYIYIVFDMLATQAGLTTQSNVTAIGTVADTNATGLNLLSTSFTLSAAGSKATVSQCYDCHGDWATGTYNMDGTRSAATGSFVGSHNKHVTSLSYACTNCHVSNTSTAHRDGYIKMANPTFFGGTYSKASGPTYSFPQVSNPTMPLGTCNTVYCHSNGTPAGSVTYATPTWGGSTNAECSSCHGGNNAAVTKISTNAHAGHISTNSGRSVGCVECHSATVSADRTISAQGLPLHANQTVNVRFNGVINLDGDAPTYNGNPATSVTVSGSQKAAGSATASCSNVYCHSIGNLNGTAMVAAGGQSYKTINWNVASVGCDGCHGDGAGKSHPTYATGSAATTTANSHVKHVEGSNLGCTYCHNLTTTGTGTTAASLALKSGGTTSHINRVEDVSFMTNGSKTGVYNAGKTCSTTYCHGAGPSVAWGGSTTCVSCHDSNSALPLRHGSHYNSTIAPTVLVGGTDQHSATAYVYSCLACHPSTQHATGPASAVAPLQDAAVTGTKVTAYVKGSASVVDGKGFNYTNNGTCTTVCHTRDGVTAGSAVVAQNWGTPVSGGGNCGVCHSKAGDASPTWTAPHNKHITSYTANANINCSSCHNGTAASNVALQATVAARNQHPNANRDLAMNTFATGGVVGITGAQGAQQCSNTYCHSIGTVAAGTHAAISWSGTTGCGSCHAATPTTFAHTAHLAVGTITCNNCHAATASNNTTISTYANHVDKNVTISFSPASSGATGSYNGVPAGGGAVYQKPVAGVTTGATCNSTLCHGGNSQNWTTTNAGVSTCVKCHGVAIATTAQYGANTDLAAPGYVSVSAPVGTGVNTAGVVGAITNGVSADKKVGAHNAHLNSNNLGYKTSGIACNECHSVTLINDAGHMNGSTTFTWGTLASTGVTPTYNSTTSGCATNYCHGGGFAVTTIGTDTTPTWTDGNYLTNSASAANQADCSKCHLSPPAAPHTAVTWSATACSGCHPHTGSGNALHINGILESNGGTCDSCHSYDLDAAGDWGKSPKAAEGWGAHATHISHLKVVSGVTLSAGGDSFNSANYNAICGVCHTRNSGNHAMGGTPNTRSINFGTDVAASLYSFGTGTPLYNGQTGTSSAITPKTCSNISCHFQATPVWQGF